MRVLAFLILAAAVFAQTPGFAPNGVLTGRLGAAPPNQQPPAHTDCAADGSVVNSITREPIVRAHVTINAGGTSYTTATDSSGKWAMSNLGCAPGQLTVTRPGFLSNTGVNRAAIGGGFRGLSLVSGSPVRDIVTELKPQAVALGKVQDSDGDPVQNAQVVLLALRVADGKPHFQQAGQAMTNDLGEYRIPNIAEGKYVICAHLNQPAAAIQSNAATIAVDSCYPGPLQAGAASAMLLPAGRENKIDFTLNQVLPVHVRGTISGLPEGRGIGVNLVHRNIDADFRGNVPGAVRNNSFDFRVAPGSYMLTADYFEAGKRLTARVPIDAGSADIDNVAVHLDAGFSVSGVVQVVSQSGESPTLPQFGIVLRPEESVNSTSQMKWDSDHRSFAFNELVAGSYRLNVFQPPSFYVKSATLGGQDILNSDVTIAPGAGPIIVTLRDDGGSVEGDVVDSAGQPALAGVMLVQGSRAVTVNVPPTGHFRMPNVAPGDYMIYAWDDPSRVQYAVPEWMRRYAGGGLPVSVSAGQNSQVKLTRQQAPE
jgi:uncharacterized protein (DUF2141 family)